jgi:hypothetical protein
MPHITILKQVKKNALLLLLLLLLLLFISSLVAIIIVATQFFTHLFDKIFEKLKNSEKQ